MADTFVWAHTVNGCYTVKSGYDFMSRRKHKDLFQQAEVQPTVNVLHEACSEVNTSPKIKLFLWKVLTGSLGVSERLKTRGVCSNTCCVFCPEEAETINHMLFEWPLARQIWALANIPLPMNGFSTSIFKNIYHLIQIGKRNDVLDEAKLAAPWIMWIVWKNRNTLLFEGKNFQPNETVDKAYDDARQWKNAQIQQQDEIEGIGMSPKLWTKPEEGRFKCNIGFAWSQVKAISGAAWVLRNSDGLVLMHSRRSFSQVNTCMHAKVKSWEWALESMKSLHKRNVTFASSSMEVIKALHKPKEWPAFRGHLFLLLSFNMNQEGWDICFEDQQCNRGATEIAKSVTSDHRLHSYVASGPPIWLRGLFDEERRSTMV